MEVQTRNKAKTKEEQLERYHAFLMDMWNDTKDEPTRVSLVEYARLHNIDTNASTILSKNGIVKKVRRNKRGNLYTWNTHRPSLSMAEALLEKTRKRKRQWQLSKKAEEAVKEISEPTQDSLIQESEKTQDKQPKKEFIQNKNRTIITTKTEFRMWFFRWTKTEEKTIELE